MLCLFVCLFVCLLLLLDDIGGCTLSNPVEFEVMIRLCVLFSGNSQKLPASAHTSCTERNTTSFCAISCQDYDVFGTPCPTK